MDNLNVQAQACQHPPTRLYSWMVPNSLVLDKDGNCVLDKDGDARLENVMCVVCTDCGAVLSGAAQEFPIYDIACPECQTPLEVDRVLLINVTGVPITATGYFNVLADGAKWNVALEGVICRNCDYQAALPEFLPD